MPEQPSSDVTKLLRAFERIEGIKSKLVKQGLVNGDATHEQVLAKLRQMIPQELLKA